MQEGKTCINSLFFILNKKTKAQSQTGRQTHTVPPLRRQRQEDHEFKANLGYQVHSRPDWATQQDFFFSLKNKKKSSLFSHTNTHTQTYNQCMVGILVIIHKILKSIDFSYSMKNKVE